MVPHYGYYPPAGAVIDQNDARLHWDGRKWTLNGRPYAVPTSHRLVGATNGPLRGWYYDWGKHAWMEPSATPQAHPSQPAPSRMQPHPMQPHPTQLQHQPQPEQKSPAHQPEKECIVMEKKAQTVLEDLVKHPVAPVLGGLLVLAGYVTDEPSPPQIPDGLPEPVAKQWQMVYAQNMQRFERRMSLYRDLGLVLLGYSGTRSIVDVIGGHEAHRALVEKKVG